MEGENVILKLKNKSSCHWTEVLGISYTIYSLNVKQNHLPKPTHTLDLSMDWIWYIFVQDIPVSTATTFLNHHH